jgi:hypothetical protein
MRGFRFMLMFRQIYRRGRSLAVESEMFPDKDSNVLVDRAGVRLLLLHAQPGQQVEDLARLDL